jgi:hypothetical protein
VGGLGVAHHRQGTGHPDAKDMMMLTADTAHTHGPAVPPTRARRAGVNRGTRFLLVLTACVIAWLAGGATAHATVGVPVSIDSFGNPNLPVAPFSRTVIPLPLPHTSTTPQGTFDESNGVGTMTMSGAGNGDSGVTLEYTPTSGGSIDLTGGGSNGQIFIDFAMINGTDPSGVTTYMTATDASGNVATSPADAVGNIFAFNAAFPFSGFQGPIDFTHITKLDITFVYPTVNSGGGSRCSGQQAVGIADQRRRAQSAHADGHRAGNRDRCRGLGG